MAKKGNATVWFLWLLLLAGIGGLYYANKHFLHIPIRYPGFGIKIPSAYGMHGIDVSRYQGKIDWTEVANMEEKGLKLSFAFIKATEGADRKDPMFDRNWKECRKAGVLRGAYHYFKPLTPSTLQANHFLKTVDLQSGDMPPVLDIEEHGGLAPAQLQKGLLNWLSMVEKATGVTPILYTNSHFYERFLGDTFSRYPVWVAHYYEPIQPRIGRKWSFWQHNDRGHVNGIVNFTDFNIFNGDSADMAELLVR